MTGEQMIEDGVKEDSTGDMWSIDPREVEAYDMAIEAKKIAYEKYKAFLVNLVQSTWIDNDGNYVTLESNYAEKFQRAKEEFIRASIEVEHYKERL